MRLSGKSFINDKKDNTLSNELDAKRAYENKLEISKSDFIKKYSIIIIVRYLLLQLMDLKMPITFMGNFYLMIF